MAAPDADNVLVASPLVTGGILTAPAGTEVPTTIAGSTSSFTATGYVGEDGVTMSIDRTTEDVFAWGGKKVRVIQTEHSVQFQFSFLETSADVLALVFGDDNVTTDGDTTTVSVNSAELPHFALVIDAQDGDKRVRITAADAQIIEQEDIVFVHSAPTTYAVTIEVFPDGDGNNATIIYDDATGS